jgi:hypothetical protein
MKSTKFSDVATDNIVKLAALASVVDGEASDQEKNFIIEEVSHLLRISQDDLRFFLDLWIGKYQEQGVANNPGRALNFAFTALQPLSFSEKHLAFHICQGVIDIEKTVIKSELPFMLQLHKLVFS